MSTKVVIEKDVDFNDVQELLHFKKLVFFSCRFPNVNVLQELVVTHTQLTRLDLNNCGVGPQELKVICGALKNNVVSHLHLTHATVNDVQGCKTLAGCINTKSLSSLTSLCLWSCGISSRGLKVLVDAILREPFTLKELRLGSVNQDKKNPKGGKKNSGGGDGGGSRAVQLARLLQDDHGSLTSLGVESSWLSSEEMDQIFSLTKIPPRLCRLNLNFNSIAPLSRHPHMLTPTITHLYLRRIGLTMQCLTWLHDFFLALSNNNALVHLDVSENQYDDDDACQMLERIIMTCSRLRHLHVGTHAHMCRRLRVRNDFFVLCSERLCVFSLEHVWCSSDALASCIGHNNPRLKKIHLKDVKWRPKKKAEQQEEEEEEEEELSVAMRNVSSAIELSTVLTKVTLDGDDLQAEVTSRNKSALLKCKETCVLALAIACLRQKQWKDVMPIVVMHLSKSYGDQESWL